MSKVTLNNVSDITQSTSAQTTINTNSSTIQTAFDNTVSRDGTSPNQMGAALDMNSNQIINLPVPSTNNSPARLIDVVSNPTIVVPGTGTSGHVVPFLDGNNTWSGTNVIPGYVTTAQSRIRLFGNLTVYVSNSGNDSNNGLTIGTPLQHIQAAVNLVSSNYDLALNSVIIQLADGTYNEAVVLQPVLFPNEAHQSVMIQGNIATPTNVVVNGLGGACFQGVNTGCEWCIESLKMISAGGSCLASDYNSRIAYGNVNFGASAFHTTAINQGSFITSLSNYTISGSATAAHISVNYSAQYVAHTLTCTLTGTPSLNIFAQAVNLGIIYAPLFTFSGGATGQRYSSTGNALIDTGGGGANFFPGNSGGITGTGGLYV